MGRRAASARKVTYYPEQRGYIQVPIHRNVEVILLPILYFQISE